MKHPYEGLPDERKWSRAVAGRADDEIDPVVGIGARIGPDDRVVSAGSCFAQHITRHLEARGHTCFRTETAHPLLGAEIAEKLNYGVYAARYGNIYTTRQLLQLWQRATGQFVPKEPYWEDGGAFYDPFRSTIQPGGFRTLQELEADRAQHLAAVVDTFTRMNVFVFTLGLTECWTSAEDGAVYPLCPGVVVGKFVPGHHVKRNFTAEEVATDLEQFIQEVRKVNPTLRVILTISPQAQMVTTEDRHVLVEVGYSKARLRVAAERVCQLPNVHYFPSYELAMVPGTRFFAEDRRTILEAGVARGMELFFEHVVEKDAPTSAAAPEAPDAAARASDTFLEDALRIIQVLCDEDFIDAVEGDESTSLIRRMLEEAKPTEPLSEVDGRKVKARALAIEGKLAEAIDLVEQLHRETPRPGLAYLLERWRGELTGSGAPRPQP